MFDRFLDLMTLTGHLVDPTGQPGSKLQLSDISRFTGETFYKMINL